MNYGLILICKEENIKMLHNYIIVHKFIINRLIIMLLNTDLLTYSLLKLIAICLLNSLKNHNNYT